jgi:hypothetical protein
MRGMSNSFYTADLFPIIKSSPKIKIHKIVMFPIVVYVCVRVRVFVN